MTTPTLIDIYIAGEYSAPPDIQDNIVAAAIRDANYARHLSALHTITNHGLVAFSPIVMFHDMAKRYTLPTDAEFYRGINYRFLDLCTELWAIESPGLNESQGTEDEWKRKDSEDIGEDVHCVTLSELPGHCEAFKARHGA